MKKGLISVIIPIYNTAAFFNECVESVLMQTYRNLEILLIDDGSTDGSGELCDRFAEKDSRIKVFHRSNSGVSAVRNFGLEHSAGEFISFVDSDDRIKPEMLEIMLEESEKSNADLVICRVNAVSVSGELLRTSPMFDVGNVVFTGNEMLEKLVLSPLPSYIVPWNKLYRKKCFDEVYYPNGKIHEDEFVIHRIFGNCSRISCVNDVLYDYRIRSDSIMNKKVDCKRIDGVCAYLDRTDFFLSKNKIMLAQKTLYSAMCLLCDLCVKISDDTEKEFAHFSAQIIEKSKIAGMDFLPEKEKIRFKAFSLSPTLYYKLLNMVSGKSGQKTNAKK